MPLYAMQVIGAGAAEQVGQTKRGGRQREQEKGGVGGDSGQTGIEHVLILPDLRAGGS